MRRLTSSISQLLPNDEEEQHRLDLQHHVFKLILDGDITFTKLREPLRILDVGTGTGISPIKAGELYSGAEVTGVDLSPILPEWIPVNVRFEVDDLPQPWTWNHETFDFVHVRALGGAIKNWVAFLKEIFVHLKPGARVEISGIRAQFYCDDGSLLPDSSCQNFQTTFHDLAETIGVNFDPMPHVSGCLKEAGL